jgi:hypothetical protein
MSITRPNGTPLITGGGGIEMAPLGYLGHGRTKSLNCHHSAVGFNTDTTMIIEIRYRTFYWPAKLSERFRFQAEKADDGTWAWKNNDRAMLPFDATPRFSTFCTSSHQFRHLSS